MAGGCLCRQNRGRVQKARPQLQGVGRIQLRNCVISCAAACQAPIKTSLAAAGMLEMFRGSRALAC